MIVTIHQPDFLPWLGFFDRWRKSDLFIVLDDVQFLRRGWHHRDRIKTANGAQWLTVPVKKKGRLHQLIREVEIDLDSHWRNTHLKTIQVNYHRAPDFDACYSFLDVIYSKQHTRLLDFNLDLLQIVRKHLAIATPMVLASTFAIRSSATQRLVDLIKQVKGDCYLTGLGAKNYLDPVTFAAERIEIIWQDFRHPVYPQLHGDFIPNLSVLDYLMNCLTEPVW
ncbi:MAG: hypothetical protein C4527_23335 [Candidatus Omnitrophota bacterium]|jgi:hypothetical protein|nr:MAG: hypothetical protein C4527_23335 [Candidatus Omnitrophota bacterium]